MWWFRNIWVTLLAPVPTLGVGGEPRRQILPLGQGETPVLMVPSVLKSSAHTDSYLVLAYSCDSYHLST